jgi:hypothetical protein
VEEVNSAIKRLKSRMEDDKMRLGQLLEEKEQRAQQSSDNSCDDAVESAEAGKSVNIYLNFYLK